jgi:outer membrane receptor protein involved in Fe transport
LGAGPGIFPDVGFVPAGGTYRKRLNLDAIRSTGVELFGEARIGAMTARAAYAHTDPRVEASGPAAGLDGKRPALTPLDQASASLGWAPALGLDASVTARYSGPQFEDDQNLRRLAGALTVDAALRLPLGHGVSLELSGENLFDVLVPSGVSADGVIDRGQPRTLWVGLRWTGR